MRSLMMILGLLFIALCHPSFAQKQAAAPEVEVAVAEGAPLTVECALRPEQPAEWRRDGGAVPADLRPAGEAAARGAALARLSAPAARAPHAGLYTCARGPGAARVRVRVLPAPAAAPAPAPAAPAPGPAAPAPAADGVEWSRLLYDLNRNITLDCRPADPAAALADSYSWTVNGSALAADDTRFKLSAAGAVLGAERAGEELWGNYSCAAGGLAVRGWRVAARPVLRMPADAHVVEGQRLRLACRVLGRPAPPLRWTYRRSQDDNATDVHAVEALAARVSVNASAAGVPGAELTVDPAAADDAGFYACVADEAAAPAETQLRVKDMYAALWPFLGICAEVFILCAIILVYERRRTKPELDDSDTDNHEQ